jgi:hypothetical protein
MGVTALYTIAITIPKNPSSVPFSSDDAAILERNKRKVLGPGVSTTVIAAQYTPKIWIDNHYKPKLQKVTPVSEKRFIDFLKASRAWMYVKGSKIFS